MYKLIKPKGYYVISVVNTDTSGVVNISVPYTSIVSMLRESGIEENLLKMSEEWDISISKELTDKLLATTLKMKKPIRDQRKKDKPKDLFQKPNSEINALDVLLGLAKYN